MKVIVFGATGGTGNLVIQQALESGFEVTAFVRNPQKLILKNANFKIVQGDVLQQNSIDNFMNGHDAVISCLGMPATKVGKLRSVGTQNIINSMIKFDVSRLVCQTSLGYGDSKTVLDYTPFIFRKIIVPYLLKKTFEDHLLQENIIQKSNINWTIVRPGNLINGKQTGNYKSGFDYNDSTLKVKISRADVAEFLIKSIADQNSYNKVLGISY